MLCAILLLLYVVVLSRYRSVGVPAIQPSSHPAILSGRVQYNTVRYRIIQHDTLMYTVTPRLIILYSSIPHCSLLTINRMSAARDKMPLFRVFLYRGDTTHPGSRCFQCSRQYPEKRSTVLSCVLRLLYRCLISNRQTVPTPRFIRPRWCAVCALLRIFGYQISTPRYLRSSVLPPDAGI